MNDLERSVIEAAIAWRSADTYPPPGPVVAALMSAVTALRDHREALKQAGLTEVSWAQVAEGDELRGKSGELYPVVATKREWSMGKPTGNFLITVKVAGKAFVLTKSEGRATVLRGAAGKAVDTFVHVFASGEL